MKLNSNATVNRSCLILGGARSGKSSYAEGLARAQQGRFHYIATAEAYDVEMEARIEQHRLERGSLWTTHEVPLELLSCLKGLEDESNAVVVVDCLTLWLTNLMLADYDVQDARDHLVSFVANCRYPLFIVSNEVGLGIVPDNALARQFRDEAGRLNQKIAASASRVIFLAAGLPMVLKATA